MSLWMRFDFWEIVPLGDWESLWPSPRLTEDGTPPFFWARQLVLRLTIRC